MYLGIKYILKIYNFYDKYAIPIGHAIEGDYDKK